MSLQHDNSDFEGNGFRLEFAVFTRKVWFCKTSILTCEFTGNARLFSLTKFHTRRRLYTSIDVNNLVRRASFNQTKFSRVEFGDICLGSTLKPLPKPKVYSNWKYLFAYNGKILQHNRYGFLGKASGWISKQGENIDFIHITRFDPDGLPAYQTNHNEYWKPMSCIEIN